MQTDWERLFFSLALYVVKAKVYQDNENIARARAELDFAAGLIDTVKLEGVPAEYHAEEAEHIPE